MFHVSLSASRPTNEEIQKAERTLNSIAQERAIASGRLKAHSNVQLLNMFPFID